MSRPRLLVVADSDSFLKWAGRLTASQNAEVVVLDTPITPSPAQREAAGARPRVVGIGRLLLTLARQRYDVVVLACTGPALQAVVLLAARLCWRGPDRPVIVSGLPGVSHHANRRALQARVGTDLLVLHSAEEVARHAALGADVVGAPRPTLARLPFLDPVPGPAGERRDVVLAAQAMVPAARADRLRLLEALLAVPPHYRPVIKVRAGSGERQTHDEADPYPALLADLRAAGLEREVAIVDGSMQEALATAAVVVTVSSTAALEAMAADVAVLVIGDFGVGAELMNEVFLDAGVVGTLADLRAGRWRRADPDWCRRTYFHTDERWADDVEALLAAPRPRLPREAGRATGDGVLGDLRRQVRLWLPWGLLRALRRLAHR